MINSANRTSFTGKKIVFTGFLDSMSRVEAAELAVNMGATVRSHVGKDIDFVVAGLGAGSRLDKAQLLGIPVLDEAAFTGMLHA